MYSKNFLPILLIISKPCIFFWIGYIIATKNNFLAGLFLMNVAVAYAIAMLIDYIYMVVNNK